MAKKPEKVERGGEVQPDTADKGSDADKARHEQGIPASDGPGQGKLDPPRPRRSDEDEDAHIGATEDQVSDTSPPVGYGFKGEPKQG